MTQPKQRLDVALVERGLAPTRAKAQSLIMARRVQVNGHFIDKPGISVLPDDDITISEPEHPYVSRGGLKLQRAVESFGIELKDGICVDIGASTGGFTDVMLRAGAKKVYAVDVGYGQLDASLRNDSRVVVRERVNARFLERADFEDEISFASIDVSFISLRLILPAVARIITPGGEVVALIKPQFEVGKGEVGKGGIVRDERKRQEAVDSVLETARDLAFEVAGVIESPIKGAEGNVEYLAHLRRGSGEDLQPRIAQQHQ